MTTTQTAPADQRATGTLEHVAPGSLLLERNIREAKPSPSLVASVKALGVLEPITAATSPAGLVVRLGHRRTLAALEAGLDTVPVYVVGVDDLDNEAEIRRVLSQHDESTQRQGLTAADEVGVVEQLVAFGLSAEEISKQARVDRTSVDQAITVTSSPLARKATTKYESLTLDQAAAVAEFEDDPELVKGLIVTAIERPGNFNHAAQRARDDRARAEKIRSKTEELMAKGVKVIDEPPYNGKVQNLTNLSTADGKDLTLRLHAKCSGHLAWFRASIHPDPIYGCSDPKKYGHKDRWGGSSSKPAAADLPPAEREKAKKARRLVIENNKAWDSAETVRRAWLADLAKRKSAPKGAAAHVAAFIGHESMTGLAGSDLAAEWLGLPTGYGAKSSLGQLAGSTTETRALLIALVRILAGIEAVCSRQSWREDGKTSAAGRHLRYLESIGYELSDVEKYAVSSKRGN